MFQNFFDCAKYLIKFSHVTSIQIQFYEENIVQKEIHKIISFQKQLYLYKIFLILMPHFCLIILVLLYSKITFYVVSHYKLFQNFFDCAKYLIKFSHVTSIQIQFYEENIVQKEIHKIISFQKQLYLYKF